MYERELIYLEKNYNNLYGGDNEIIKTTSEHLSDSVDELIKKLTDDQQTINKIPDHINKISNEYSDIIYDLAVKNKKLEDDNEENKILIENKKQLEANDIYKLIKYLKKEDKINETFYQRCSREYYVLKYLMEDYEWATYDESDFVVYVKAKLKGTPNDLKITDEEIKKIYEHLKKDTRMGRPHS